MDKPSSLSLPTIGDGKKFDNIDNSTSAATTPSSSKLPSTTLTAATETSAFTSACLPHSPSTVCRCQLLKPFFSSSSQQNNIKWGLFRNDTSLGRSVWNRFSNFQSVVRQHCAMHTWCQIVNITKIL